MMHTKNMLSTPSADPIHAGYEDDVVTNTISSQEMVRATPGWSAMASTPDKGGPGANSRWNHGSAKGTTQQRLSSLPKRAARLEPQS
jgi:hypothetical protein